MMSITEQNTYMVKCAKLKSENAALREENLRVKRDCEVQERNIGDAAKIAAALRSRLDRAEEALNWIANYDKNFKRFTGETLQITTAAKNYFTSNDLPRHEAGDK